MSTKTKELVKSTDGEKEGPSTTNDAKEENKKSGSRRRRGNPRPHKVEASGDDPFAPRHVTAPGPVINDPLGDKCFLPKTGAEFQRISGSSYIYPGAEGMTKLAAKEYQALESRSYCVKREITQVAYTYYVGCLTWARLLHVDGKNGGNISLAEQEFIDAMTRYRPPRLLHSYLSGIGNTEFPGGFNKLEARIAHPAYVTLKALTEKVKDKTIYTPRITGWFGPLEEAARYYGAYPCLGVLAYQIVQEIVAEADASRWDFPTQFRIPGHPVTDACIGYALVSRISDDAKATYERCGITSRAFRSDNQELPVCLSLLDEIQTWIDEIQDIAVVPFPVATTGSRGLLLSEEIHTPPSSRYDTGWQAVSALRLPPAVEFAGSTFLYRAWKKISDTLDLEIARLYVPFEIGDNRNIIPPDLAFLRDLELDPLLRSVCGVSAVYTLEQRLRGFVAADVSRQTKD